MDEKVITLGEVQVGDRVLGPDGSYSRVARVHDIHLPESMFRLTFEGKEGAKVIEASGNHLWYCETSLDRSLHRKRLKEGVKIFKDLTEEQKSDLFEIVLSEHPQLDVSLSDMIDLLGARELPARWQALVRIAESLGPVVEETTQVRDLYDDKVEEESTERLYDAKLFAKQVLGFTSRALRKKWPLIVGRVVTTEELALLALEVAIPEVREKM